VLLRREEEKKHNGGEEEKEKDLEFLIYHYGCFRYFTSLILFFVKKITRGN